MLENLLHSDHSELWKSLTAAIPGYAKASGLVKRISKGFDPADFLLTLLAASTTGKSTLNLLAIALRTKKSGGTISPQAVHQRIIRTETGLEKFLILCLVHICQWKWSISAQSATNPFGRIIVEDSTFVRMYKSNSENFPAHGNASGKTAGCKIDLAFVLISGDILSNQLHSGTQQDKEIGESLLNLIRSDDLVLRDMGYFGVGWFKSIEEAGAFWLSRLPLNVKATGVDGKAIETILASYSGEDLDIRAEITDSKHPARLIAVRASKQEAEKRRRELRAQAKAKGRTVPQRSLILAGWHILVTNIPKEMQGVEQLVAIYSQRWQIEIVFRGWKQASNLGIALGRKSSPQHHKGLVLAGMIVLSIGVKIAISLARKQGGRYSLEKIYQFLCLNIILIIELTQISEFQPHLPHIKTQKRTRKSLATRYFEVLS